MRRSLARVWPSLLALSLLAAPAGAEIYRVTLNNGQTFDTNYQPQEASWDASMVLLMSDVGNWIGVSKADIQQVEPVNETGSFGVQIAVNTYELGMTANDVPETPAAGSGDSKSQMLQLMLQDQQAETQRKDAEAKYSVNQFVEPNQTQGIPPRFVDANPKPPLPPVPQQPAFNNQ